MPAALHHIPTDHVALCAAVPLPASGDQAAVPDFIHLLPAGLIQTRDGRGPFRLDDAASVAAASLESGASLPLDENHSTDLAAPQGGPAPARGWITQLQVRADGLWGRVEWTAEGRALIAGRAYRHVSPAIQCDAQGRVLRVLRASLVNVPNLQRLTALNAAHDTAILEPSMDMIKLREALGLAPDATEQALLDALRPLLDKIGGASARPDPTKWVPIEDFQRAISEANKLRQGVSRHAAEQQVGDDIRKGVILPWMKDWAVNLCMTSAPSYDNFIRGVGPGFSTLLNSQTAPRARLSPSFAQSGLSDDEKSIARNLGLTDEEYAATRG